MGRTLSEKNVIGGVTAADNGGGSATDIDKKEEQAISFLQSIAKQHQPLFLAYSGGKDSEVILHLANKAQIEFTPFYSATSNDQPGTIKWIEDKQDVMIMRPQRTFFELIEHRGLPSYFMRFCCDKLKERYVAKHVITGVRRSESWKRARRYSEPEMCYEYKHGKKGIIYMPILYWTDADVKAYIEKENIKCHPYYYDVDGQFHVERRLGCLACPLRNDRGIADFKRYPRLVRAWCRALAVYRNTRPKLTKSVTYFHDEYEHFYHNIFHHSLSELEYKRSRPQGFDPRRELMEYFNVELPPAQSDLETVKQRIQQAQAR